MFHQEASVETIKMYMCDVIQRTLQCEDKKFKATWDVEPCISALKLVLTRNIVSQSIKNMLEYFLHR